MITNNASLNPVLQAIASQYASNMTGFLAPKLAPVFQTPSATGVYYQMNRANYLQFPENTLRQPGSRTSRIGVQVDKDSYICEEQALETALDYVESAMYRTAFDADKASTEKTILGLLLKREQRVAAIATAASVPNATLTAPQQFNTAGSTPISTIKNAKSLVFDQCGMEPDLIGMSRTVYNVLCEHPTITDRTKYTSKESVTPQILANLFGFKELVIADSTIATSVEGQPLSIAQIWGDKVIMAVTNNSTDMRALNFMRTFNFSAVSSGEYTIRQYEEEQTNSVVYRASHMVVEKPVCSFAGYWLNDVLA